MEENSNSTGGGSGGEDPNRRIQQLKNLNKNSYKISKPSSSNNSNNSSLKVSSFDQNQNQSNNIQVQPPPTAVLQQSATLFPLVEEDDDQSLPLPTAPHHQPPVYNINKADFREIVQRLTGAPRRDRFSNPPPPINQPRPSSSRLQRIRPPPLSHVGVRPVSSRPNLNSASIENPPPPVNFSSGFMPRPVGPHSPLPPFPAVHTAAESPVSAYLRYFHTTSPGFSGFATSTPPPPPPAEPQNHQLAAAPPASGSSSASQSPPQFQMPTSPLPFGCMNPPLSPYPLHSPTSSQFTFPLSPAASPKWKGI